MATAIATEMTPASSEARAPQIMREKMSRPSSSVPSQCAADGALRIAAKLVGDGSGIGSTGARSASSAKKADDDSAAGHGAPVALELAPSARLGAAAARTCPAGGRAIASSTRSSGAG